MKVNMEKIKPRILPRSLPDFIFVFLVFIIQTIILYLIPSLIVLLITNNVIFVFATVFVIWMYFITGGVRYLIINDDGIFFKRILGNPNKILSEELESIEISNPLNTIVYGWLWPPLPAREMTYSLSSQQHVKFTYGKGKFVFFPPKNIADFYDVIEKYKQ